MSGSRSTPVLLIADILLALSRSAKGRPLVTLCSWDGGSRWALTNGSATILVQPFGALTLTSFSGWKPKAGRTSGRTGTEEL